MGKDYTPFKMRENPMQRNFPGQIKPMGNIDPNENIQEKIDRKTEEKVDEVVDNLIQQKSGDGLNI